MTDPPRPPAPTRLRCQHLDDPLGVDEPAPRLSWALDPVEVADCHVVVASDPRMDDPIWDTGRIPLPALPLLAYGGPAPGSRQRLWWTVRVWDATGAASPWATPAFWEMGLLQPDEWRGSWVGTPWPLDSHETYRPCPHLRTEFTLDRRPQRARLYASALGLYRIWLNGRRVSDDELAPGWTDYNRRVPYRAYDVTDLLREGPNAVGVLLGDGWFAGRVAFGRMRGRWGTLPRALAQVETEDGPVAHTGPHWRTSFGALLCSDLLGGEVYDARAELGDWTEPGYDDSGWRPASVLAATAGRLVAHPGPAVRAVARHEARRTGGEVWDLGTNIAGRLRLEVTAPAGSRVEVRHAEVLDADGGLYTANLRDADATDTYIAAGTGKEVWEPAFTYHGFRYAQISSPAGAEVAATGVALSTDVEETLSFSCSDPMVERLHAAIAATRRANHLEVPADCPQRDERLGWTGDALAFCPTSLYLVDSASFWTKWMRDVADAFSPERGFPDVAPLVEWGAVNLAEGAPGFGDAGVFVPWTLYLFTGDSGVLSEHYPSMCRWVELLDELNPDGLWRNRRGNDWGDWLAAVDSPKEVVATAFWARSADLTSRTALVLGRGDEAARYRELADRVRDAFVEAYVGEDGSVRGDTQTVYALALRFGLVPSRLRAATRDRLVADVDSHGLTAGYVGVPQLLFALTDARRTDLAYRLVLSRQQPSWGFMLDHGATTLWERWDSWTPHDGFADPFMNSFCHSTLGSVGEWLYATVGGVAPEARGPGFRRVLVRPRPGGGVTHADTSYVSASGTIRCAWQLADDAFELEVTIPGGCAATVHVPAVEGDQVHDVGAGTHHFVSTPAPEWCRV